MTHRMGPVEFFAMEASDYLERLDAVVSRPTPPDPSELVRLARALRGSAIMAKQDPIAQVATAFERFTRAVMEGRRPWNEATKQLAVRGVDDMKILIRQLGEGSGPDAEKARRLAADLDPEVGAPRTSGPFVAETGERVFLAREAAALATALDQAAKTLQRDASDRAAIQRLVDAVQPLRGVATLGDYPPLADLLQAVEYAAAGLLGGAAAERQTPIALHAGSRALNRVAADIQRTGAPDSSATEIHAFVHHLRELLAGEAVSVPIESLYYDDEGPHVVEEGRPPQTRELGTVDLVSHGEHLREVADRLEEARSSVQLELRALALTETFRALSVAEGEPLLDGVAAFATAARRALHRGCATQHRADFAQQLRDASGVLARAASEEKARLSGRLSEIVMTLDDLPGSPMRTSGPQVAPATVPATASAAGTTSIEATAAAEAPETPAETGGFAASWDTYERLVAAAPATPPAFDDFLAGHIPTPPAAAAAPVAEEIVPIGDLCYSGPVALERAMALEAEIRAQLRAGPPTAELTALLDEVFDLVRLGSTE